MTSLVSSVVYESGDKAITVRSLIDLLAGIPMVDSRTQEPNRIWISNDDGSLSPCREVGYPDPLSPNGCNLVFYRDARKSSVEIPDGKDLEDCRAKDVSLCKDVDREYRERLSAELKLSEAWIEEATKGQDARTSARVEEDHGSCSFPNMTDVDFHGGRPDGSRGSSGCRKQIEAAERVTEKEIVPLDEKNKVRLSSGEEPKIDCDFNESKILVEVGTANDAEVGQILERCKNRWASRTVEFVPIRNGEVPSDDPEES